MKKYLIFGIMAMAAIVSCKKDDAIQNANLSAIILSEIDGTQDFIELFNTGVETVSLEGAKIRRMRTLNGADDEQTLWTGKKGVSIAPGEYLCLPFVVGKEDQPRNLKRDFSPKKNTYIWLQNGAGHKFCEFTRGSKENGWNNIRMQKCKDENDVAYSYSLVDGSWVYALPTPGAENGKKAGNIDQTLLPIVINEIDLNNNWIELYNTSNKAVSLLGLQLRWSLIKDNEAENLTIWEVTKNSSLEANGYKVIEFTDGKEAGTLQLKFSDYADKNFHLRLRDANKEDFTGKNYIFDDIKRGEKGTGWTTTTLPTLVTGSFARIPDGSGDWYMVQASTKGTTNGKDTTAKPAPDVDQD